MSNYTPTIGLEIHAELKTQTKMFCDSKNDPDEKEPNKNICPICTAHPGTLPVINKEAVKSVLKVGLAFGSQIADFTEFDRKNYFYPDIPKGYQISQYKYPLVSGGELSGVKITRVHLEEDTASNIHDETLTGKEHSFVDFNRSGIPLMELVTEPVIEGAKQAGDFARELQLLLRYLGVSDANMEKGQMRIEANVSVRLAEKRGIDAEERGSELGTKVEVKNLNSFKSVERAIDYEIERQIGELEDGGEIVQETRGWDENKQITFSQRVKEGSADYRYFPEPDLPKLKLSEIPEFSEAELKKELPELPWEKRERYKKDYGIKEEDIESFVSDFELAKFFEEVAEKLGAPEKVKLASNYITSDLLGLLRSDLGESEGRTLDKLPEIGAFVAIIEMASGGEISSRGAKDLLKEVFENGGNPREVAEKKGLFQKSDEGELKAVIKKVIAENEKVAEDYKSGNEKLIQFLVGQGMQATKGSANPQVLKKLFEEALH